MIQTARAYALGRRMLALSTLLAACSGEPNAGRSSSGAVPSVAPGATVTQPEVAASGVAGSVAFGSYERQRSNSRAVDVNLPLDCWVALDLSH